MPEALEEGLGDEGRRTVRDSTSEPAQEHSREKAPHWLEANAADSRIARHRRGKFGQEPRVRTSPGTGMVAGIQHRLSQVSARIETLKNPGAAPPY